jgi:hypothetical protein
MFSYLAACAFLIDHSVRYVPDWFPGTEFKAIAKAVRDRYESSRKGTIEYVKNVMKVRPHSHQTWGTIEP